MTKAEIKKAVEAVCNLAVPGVKGWSWGWSDSNGCLMYPKQEKGPADSYSKAMDALEAISDALDKAYGESEDVTRYGSDGVRWIVDGWEVFAFYSDTWGVTYVRVENPPEPTPDSANPDPIPTDLSNL